MRKLARPPGFIVDKRDNDGTTLLMESARQGTYESLTQCLDEGASLNAVDYAGRNALMYAIEGKSDGAAAILLNRGIDAGCRDKLGNTPLIEACKEQIPEVIQRLIAKNVALDVQNDKGNTALIFACANGDGWAACKLADAGADAEQLTNHEGNSALTIARKCMRPQDFATFETCVAAQREKKRLSAIAAAEEKERQLAQHVVEATVLQRDVTPLKPVAFRPKAP